MMVCIMAMLCVAACVCVLPTDANAQCRNGFCGPGLQNQSHQYSPVYVDTSQRQYSPVYLNPSGVHYPMAWQPPNYRRSFGVSFHSQKVYSQPHYR